MIIEHPKVIVKIKHSQSKSAWNIIGTRLGYKYKIAIIPYLKLGNNEIFDTRSKADALKHAEFICFCFNNPERILV